MEGIELLIVKGIGLLVMKGIGLLIRKGLWSLGVKYCFFPDDESHAIQI